MTLDGQTFVVTGAASGIGAATAALLCDAGAEVIGVDRNTAADFPGTFVQADLSTAAGVAAAAGQIPEGIRTHSNTISLDSGQKIAYQHPETIEQLEAWRSRTGNGQA